MLTKVQKWITEITDGSQRDHREGYVTLQSTHDETSNLGLCDGKKMYNLKNQNKFSDQFYEGEYKEVDKKIVFLALTINDFRRIFDFRKATN